MRLRVLGSHGGELPTSRSTCFLIDDHLALDAGALNRGLDVAGLQRVQHVLLTHSHFDHVKDLPLMGDVLIGHQRRGVDVYGSTECIRTLRRHMFNDALWPDFTRLPSRQAPMFRLHSFRARSRFRIGRYNVVAVPVDHPVESCGFVISDGKVSLGVSGDTGPTDALWKLMRRTENLAGVLIETSFPNAQQRLADVSGHLTPRTLKVELQKLGRPDVPVWLYHLKPRHVQVVTREVSRLPVRVAEIGDVYDL